MTVSKKLRDFAQSLVGNRVLDLYLLLFLLLFLRVKQLWKNF